MPPFPLQDAGPFEAVRQRFGVPGHIPAQLIDDLFGTFDVFSVPPSLLRAQGVRELYQSATSAAGGAGKYSGVRLQVTDGVLEVRGLWVPAQVELYVSDASGGMWVPGASVFFRDQDGREANGGVFNPVSFACGTDDAGAPGNGDLLFLAPGFNPWPVVVTPTSRIFQLVHSTVNTALKLAVLGRWRRLQGQER